MPRSFRQNHLRDFYVPFVGFTAVLSDNFVVRAVDASAHESGSSDTVSAAPILNGLTVVVPLAARWNLGDGKAFFPQVIGDRRTPA